nr:MAG TPA: hypothetical protein [Caudoviricetes sp.]
MNLCLPQCQQWQWQAKRSKRSANFLVAGVKRVSLTLAPSARNPPS